MPTGNEMFKLLNQLDIAYKAEMILYQMHSIVFWTTTLELAMFCTLFVIFCTAPKSMAIMWLTVLHLPRGVIGAFLLKNLPKSHEIIEDLRFDDIPQTQMSVETVSEKIKFSLSVQFMLMAENNKKWLTFYSLLTAACYMLDGLTFLIVLWRFTKITGQEHSEMIMLFACLFNFGIDMFYFLWVVVLRERLPPKLGSVISDAVFGYTKKMTRELYGNLDQNQRGMVEETKHVMKMERNIAAKKAHEEAEHLKQQQESDKRVKKET